MGVTLQTKENRLDFLVQGERFATYQYGAERVPGFTCLMAPGERRITELEPRSGMGLWLAHGNVNGVAFGREEENASLQEQGRIVSTDLMVRRGTFSAGFQQTCAWLDSEKRCHLTDVRTIRMQPGPGTGRTLDWTITLQAPKERAVLFGRTEAAFLQMQVASSLRPSGGGQLRNSLGEYGAETMNGRSAAWCAGVGVVAGETVGFAFLEHPTNPWYPTPWRTTSEGLLSPSPFVWRQESLAPRETLTLRYRLLIHQGYVEMGWATERLQEFAHDPSPG